MTLSEYQAAVVDTAHHPSLAHSEKEVLLFGLAGEVGELVGEYKRYLRDGDAHGSYTARVQEELGDLLWYIAATARAFDLSLDAVAEANLMKARDRWAPGAIGAGADLPPPHRFDARCPENEQIPRQFSLKMVQVTDGDRTRIRLYRNGEQVGNDLTDNAHEADGYRFHDLFHLAFAAVLGWSPVTRQLLVCERNSDPKVREVEDGGRAKVIDEGISAMVFAYAVDRNFLEGVEAVDHDLLRTIRAMTRHLEVSRCTEREWQAAILQGYATWRNAQLSGGGLIHCDLDQRRIWID